MPSVIRSDSDLAARIFGLVSERIRSGDELLAVHACEDERVYEFRLAAGPVTMLTVHAHVAVAGITTCTIEVDRDIMGSYSLKVSGGEIEYVDCGPREAEDVCRWLREGKLKPLGFVPDPVDLVTDLETPEWMPQAPPFRSPNRVVLEVPELREEIRELVERRFQETPQAVATKVSLFAVDQELLLGEDGETSVSLIIHDKSQGPETHVLVFARGYEQPACWIGLEKDRVVLEECTPEQLDELLRQVRDGIPHPGNRVAYGAVDESGVVTEIFYVETDGPPAKPSEAVRLGLSSGRYVREGYDGPLRFSFAPGGFIDFCPVFWQELAQGRIFELTDWIDDYPGGVSAVQGEEDSYLIFEPGTELELPESSRFGPRYVFWHSADEGPRGTQYGVYQERMESGGYIGARFPLQGWFRKTRSE